MPISKVAALLLAACAFSVEARAQQPSNASIGEVFATDATVSGSVVLAAGGTRVASGSAVAAGRTAASLRLDRGGEVRVCPGTSVNVTAAARSQGLMLSLSDGTIETHYSVGSSADTIQTPDFRILFPGPGDFHFAVRADASGNTCIRALDGNTASVVVAEMMGDGTYQVRPNEQITFSDGKVSNAVPFGKCGCSAVTQALQADTVPSKPVAVYSVNNIAPPPINIPTSEVKPPQPESKSDPSVAATPPLKPEEVHVQVEVPMVYSADSPAVPTSGAPVLAAPNPLYLPAGVYMALFRPVWDLPTVTPLAPAGKPQKEKKGFFGRMKSFFGGMFH